MKMTVLVLTYRCLQDVERCLKALQQQNCAADEVLAIVRDTDKKTHAFLQAFYNGLLVKRQRFFKDAERKLKLLQQRVCRKKLGSNNWRKAQKKVAKLHEYVANSRKDWHRKLSHQSRTRRAINP